MDIVKLLLQLNPKAGFYQLDAPTVFVNFMGFMELRINGNVNPGLINP